MIIDSHSLHLPIDYLNCSICEHFSTVLDPDENHKSAHQVVETVVRVVIFKIILLIA